MSAAMRVGRPQERSLALEDGGQQSWSGSPTRGLTPPRRGVTPPLGPLRRPSPPELNLANSPRLNLSNEKVDGVAQKYFSQKESLLPASLIECRDLRIVVVDGEDLQVESLVDFFRELLKVNHPYLEMRMHRSYVKRVVPLASVALTAEEFFKRRILFDGEDPNIFKMTLAYPPGKGETSHYLNIVDAEEIEGEELEPVNGTMRNEYAAKDLEGASQPAVSLPIAARVLQAPASSLAEEEKEPAYLEDLDWYEGSKV